MSDSARIAFWVYILALILLFGLPAQAHTSEEVATWMAEWQADYPDSGLTLEHAALFVDWHERHFWHFHDRPVIRTPQRSAPRPPSTWGAGVEPWRGLVAAYFPANEVDRALCIMWHESRGDPSAKNPTSSARGLMQILASLWAPEFGLAYDDLYDPETNMWAARKVWDIQGWWGWSPYKRGECR